jgi:hypothetical protein
MALVGVGGNDIYCNKKDQLLNGTRVYEKSTEVLQRWQKEGDQTRIPRLTMDDPNNNFRQSDLFIESGNYLRLSNLQLGYTISPKWIRKIGITHSRIYLSANNLYTFTNYSGYDPEINISNPLSGGIDSYTYPVTRTFLFGLNLTF